MRDMWSELSALRKQLHQTRSSSGKLHPVIKSAPSEDVRTISIVCSGCRKQGKMRMAYLGHKVRCKDCGTTFVPVVSREDDGATKRFDTTEIIIVPAF